jgi:hypothetical protein
MTTPVKFRPDPSFRYTASFNTDLRKTFARIRDRQRQEPGPAVPTPSAPSNVASIVRTTAGGKRE